MTSKYGERKSVSMLSLQMSDAACPIVQQANFVSVQLDTNQFTDYLQSAGRLSQLSRNNYCQVAQNHGKEQGQIGFPMHYDVAICSLRPCHTTNATVTTFKHLSKTSGMLKSPAGSWPLWRDGALAHELSWYRKTQRIA